MDRTVKPAAPERRVEKRTELARPRERTIARDRSVDKDRSTLLIERTARGTERRRPVGTRRIIYEDRSSFHGGDRYHNAYHSRYEHVYRDRHNRLVHSVIWPRFSFNLCYNWGPYYRYSCVYPYYQRRYVFVSLGGWWPDYGYLRYYWYPSHYYWWYGYYPVPRVIGSTNNYYTYNYYSADSGATTYSTDGLGYADHTTYADVRERMAQQQGPEAETMADQLFDEALKAFEEADYAAAAEKFKAAMELAPHDVILPFAYAQALFAEGQYAASAAVIREALKNVTPDKEGVFYPRGLYLDEDVLMTQIYRLEEEAAQYPFNSDLQLLLGYHWLGVGEIDKSLAPLNHARSDAVNGPAAAVLLDLAEKLRDADTSAQTE
jgi:hypothetical protein